MTRNARDKREERDEEKDKEIRIRIDGCCGLKSGMLSLKKMDAKLRNRDKDRELDT